VAAAASSSDTTAYRSLGRWSGLGDGQQRVGAAIQRQGASHPWVTSKVRGAVLLVFERRWRKPRGSGGHLKIDDEPHGG
jgi:hypothetical protein